MFSKNLNVFSLWVSFTGDDHYLDLRIYVYSQLYYVSYIVAVLHVSKCQFQAFSGYASSTRIVVNNRIMEEYDWREGKEILLEHHRSVKESWYDVRGDWGAKDGSRE